jgi:hypothetical protein
VAGISRDASPLDMCVRSLLGAPLCPGDVSLAEASFPQRTTEARYAQYLLHLRLVDVLADIEGKALKLSRPRVRVYSLLYWLYALTGAE